MFSTYIGRYVDSFSRIIKVDGMIIMSVMMMMLMMIMMQYHGFIISSYITWYRMMLTCIGGESQQF